MQLGKLGAMRVVIDTNIWMSFLIGKTLANLADAIYDEKVTLQLMHYNFVSRWLVGWVEDTKTQFLGLQFVLMA